MALSPELIAHAHRRAEETRLEQGLPRFIEDPGAIERIAQLIEANQSSTEAA